MSTLIGTAPDQVSVNGMLGDLAFQSQASVSISLLSVNTNATGFVKQAATAVPIVDMLQITNVGFPIVTAGVSAQQINYIGGAAAVESSASRLDLTPGTLTGGIWNGYRTIVTTDATTGVVLNGTKFDTIATPGAGTSNALYIGTGWDSILNYNGTSIISGTGGGTFTGLTSPNLVSATTLTLNSTTTSALTIDSTTTGAINIGTNANAKIITIGNVTGATSVVINSGTGNTAFSTGNVGIGTSSPGAKLDVVGVVRSTSAASFFTQGSANILVNNGLVLGTLAKNVSPIAGTGSIQILSNDATNQLQASMSLITDVTSNTNYRLAFQCIEQGVAFRNITLCESGGNVGIGTSSPAVKLDVTGSQYIRWGNFDALTINGSSTNSVGLRIQNTVASGRNWNIAVSGGGVGAAGTFLIYDDTAAANRVAIDSSGNVGIGTPSPSYKLQVNGSFAATTKSFVIDHPTKEGMKLRYGSLESPYHGVRLTGEGVLINGTATINLPDYIHGLCKQEGSQVQITNIKHGKVIWVDDVNVDEDCFVVKSDILVHDESEYKFYWSFTAIRKDIEDMIVEFVE